MMDVNTNYEQAADNARQVIRRTKQVTRRQFSPEEKYGSSLKGSEGRSPSPPSADGKALPPTSTTSG